MISITPKSLRFKLMAGIAVVIVLLIVGILLLVNRVQIKALNDEVMAKIAAVAEVASAEMTQPFMEDDLGPLRDIMGKLIEVPDVRFGAVVDSSGNRLYSSSGQLLLPVIQTREFAEAVSTREARVVEISESGSEPYVVQIMPIMEFDRTLGALLVGFNPTRIKRASLRATKDIMVLGVMGLLVGMILAFMLARGVIRPIERLKVAATRVGMGDFGRTIDVETRDEIGALAETFNTMSLELQKREEEVRRSERLSAIGTTASAIAHEMKTPLTSVQAYTDLLQTKYEEPTFRKEFIDTVQPQIERLKNLVDDLLDYSREVRLHLMEIDLNLHIHQAVATFRDLLAQHRVSAFEDYQAEGLVQADPDKLEQVYFNLLKNAVEAMGSGGSVALATREEGGKVLSLVADSGTGIPKETAERIFEPFFTTKSKGTGLGLAIAQKMVKAHGGDIRLFTPLGTLPDDYSALVRAVLGEDWPGTEQGTCFAIRIPSNSSRGDS